MPEILAIVFSTGGVVGVLVAVFTAIKKGTPVVQLIVGVFGDFAGVPARAGVPERPGIMKRLQSIDDKLNAQAEQLNEQTEQLNTHGAQLTEHGGQLTEQAAELAAITHELHPNSGGSLRDAVDRLETHTATVTNVTITSPRPDAA